MAQMFSCEFCKVFKNTFLQNTSRRLLLFWFMSLVMLLPFYISGTIQTSEHTKGKTFANLVLSRVLESVPRRCFVKHLENLCIEVSVIIKLRDLKTVTLLKKRFRPGVFLGILDNFYKHFFHRTSLVAASGVCCPKLVFVHLFLAFGTE